MENNRVILPGNPDNDFAAHCPQCGGKNWAFVSATSGGVDHDVRKCADCGYLHYLRGMPPELERQAQITHDVDLRTIAKRDRVRALVFAVLASPNDWKRALSDGSVTNDPVLVAEQLDADIQALT